MGFKDDDDDDDKFGVRRKIMLAAVISVFTVVILLIFLHLYSRYLLRRRERRRQERILTLGREILPDLENHIARQEKVGLDLFVIASLPIFAYKPTNQADSGETECSVCLTTLVEDVKVKVLPNCKHVFHVECINMWLGSHTTCPICRAVAEPRVQPREDSNRGLEPSAPPLEPNMSHDGAQLEKVGASEPRFGSFRQLFIRD